MPILSPGERQFQPLQFEGEDEEDGLSGPVLLWVDVGEADASVDEGSPAVSEPAEAPVAAGPTCMVVVVGEGSGANPSVSLQVRMMDPKASPAVSAPLQPPP